MRRTTTTMFTGAALTAAIAVGLTPTASAFDPVPKDEFKLLLQVRGDWSGEYTGEELGLDDNTYIFVQSEGGRLNPDGPEYVDMEDHLAQLERFVNRTLPADYDGIIILDYEMFPCTLYHNGWNAFREERVQQTMREHPELTEEEALELAAAEYKVAAQDFFLRTLEKGREIRPDAKWGFFPMTAYLQNPNLPYNPGINDHVRWINDQSPWLWDAVDVIVMPGYNGWYETEAEHQGIEDAMTDKSGELKRIADGVYDRTGRRPLCVQYVHLQVLGWGNSRYGGEWYASEQVKDTIERVYEGGADGLVLWQRVREDGIASPTEEEYVEVIDRDVRAALQELELGAWAPSDDPGKTLRDRIRGSARYIKRHERASRIFAHRHYSDKIDYSFEGDELERIIRKQQDILKRLADQNRTFVKNEYQRVRQLIRMNQKRRDDLQLDGGGERVE